MGDAAVAIPADCSATCLLDFDVWTGMIRCEGVPGEVTVYGGATTMAGMRLDDRHAHVEGTELLEDAVTLRWGTSADRHFCATLTRGGWNWQLCGDDAPVQRQTILRIARGYTRVFPSDRAIVCGVASESETTR